MRLVAKVIGNVTYLLKTTKRERESERERERKGNITNYAAKAKNNEYWGKCDIKQMVWNNGKKMFCVSESVNGADAVRVKI